MALLGLPWWSILLSGVVAILFGVVALLRPGLTIASFVLLFGGYAAVDGALGLATAFRPGRGVTVIATAVALRKSIAGEWIHAAFGVLSIALGTFLVTRAPESLLSPVWVIAVYAIVAGAGLIALGIQLRSLSRRRGERALRVVRASICEDVDPGYDRPRSRNEEKCFGSVE